MDTTDIETTATTIMLITTVVTIEVSIMGIEPIEHIVAGGRELIILLPSITQTI